LLNALALLHFHIAKASLGFADIGLDRLFLFQDGFLQQLVVALILAGALFSAIPAGIRQSPR